MVRGKTNKSILLKTIIYRVNTFCITWLVMFALTKEINQAITITIIIELIRFVFYFIYEKLWNYYEKSS